MAFIHEDPEVLLTEEETEIIRIWVLHKVNEKEVGNFYHGPHIGYPGPRAEMLVGPPTFSFKIIRRAP